MSAPRRLYITPDSHVAKVCVLRTDKNQVLYISENEARVRATVLLDALSVIANSDCVDPDAAHYMANDAQNALHKWNKQYEED